MNGVSVFLQQDLPVLTSWSVYDELPHNLFHGITSAHIYCMDYTTMWYPFVTLIDMSHNLDLRIVFHDRWLIYITFCLVTHHIIILITYAMICFMKTDRRAIPTPPPHMVSISALSLRLLKYLPSTMPPLFNAIPKCKQQRSTRCNTIENASTCIRRRARNLRAQWKSFYLISTLSTVPWSVQSNFLPNDCSVQKIENQGLILKLFKKRLQKVQYVSSHPNH